MSRFLFKRLPLEGAVVVQREYLKDQRGFFSRMFCSTELREAGWISSIAQINHTYTRQKGTIRGLHFQYPPHTEMKLVSCIRGEIWDVVVDLRMGSPTFLHWHAERLSAENGYAMLVPEGFAHGFQTLVDNVELLYCHSREYHQSSEGGILPYDPVVGVSWPLAGTEISSRDMNHPLIDSGFKGIEL